jgi:hypothetical protein
LDDILIGWKAISSYLKVSEKTAQRYRDKGMPVKINEAGHPFITKADADKWMLRERKAA